TKGIPSAFGGEAMKLWLRGAAGLAAVLACVAGLTSVGILAASVAQPAALPRTGSAGAASRPGSINLASASSSATDTVAVGANQGSLARCSGKSTNGQDTARKCSPPRITASPNPNFLTLG